MSRLRVRMECTALSASDCLTSAWWWGGAPVRLSEKTTISGLCRTTSLPSCVTEENTRFVQNEKWHQHATHFFIPIRSRLERAELCHKLKFLAKLEKVLSRPHSVSMGYSTFVQSTAKNHNGRHLFWKLPNKLWRPSLTRVCPRNRPCRTNFRQSYKCWPILRDPTFLHKSNSLYLKCMMLKAWTDHFMTCTVQFDIGGSSVERCENVQRMLPGLESAQGQHRGRNILGLSPILLHKCIAHMEEW